MKKTINEYITLSEMERNRVKYLLVEGKSDPKIYSYLIEDDNIQIITPRNIDIPDKKYTGGCGAVIAILENYIPKTSEKYFIGIVDKDLHPISIFKKDCRSNGLVILNRYSIESYFINFSAFKKIIGLITELPQNKIDDLFKEESYNLFINRELVRLYNLTLFILFDYIFEKSNDVSKKSSFIVKKGRKNRLVKQSHKIKSKSRRMFCREAGKFKLSYDCDDINHVFLKQNHGMKNHIYNESKIGYIKNFIMKHWFKKYGILRIDDIEYVITNYTKGKWLLYYFSYAVLEYAKSILTDGCINSGFPCGECDSGDSLNTSQCLYLSSKSKKYKDIRDYLISNASTYDSIDFLEIKNLIKSKFS